MDEKHNEQDIIEKIKLAKLKKEKATRRGDYELAERYELEIKRLENDFRSEYGIQSS